MVEWHQMQQEGTFLLAVSPGCVIWILKTFGFAVFLLKKLQLWGSDDTGKSRVSLQRKRFLNFTFMQRSVKAWFGKAPRFLQSHIPRLVPTFLFGLTWPPMQRQVVAKSPVKWPLKKGPPLLQPHATAPPASHALSMLVLSLTHHDGAVESGTLGRKHLQDLQNIKVNERTSCFQQITIFNQCRFAHADWPFGHQTLPTPWACSFPRGSRIQEKCKQLHSAFFYSVFPLLTGSKEM